MLDSLIHRLDYAFAQLLTPARVISPHDQTLLQTDYRIQRNYTGQKLVGTTILMEIELLNAKVECALELHQTTSSQKTRCRPLQIMGLGVKKTR